MIDANDMFDVLNLLNGQDFCKEVEGKQKWVPY